MVRRMIMGYNPHVGDHGLFISKPGVDISNTATNYLLDSRYRTLMLHANGANTMSKVSTGGATIWYSEISFPDLGYRPVFFGNIVNMSANSAGLPVNTAGFPISWAGVAGRVGSGGEAFLESSVWLVNNTTLRARTVMNVNGSGATMQFRWMVFKNRFE